MASESELEHDTWYWASHPHEGDVFYPVYVVDDVHLLMDGDHSRRDESTGLVFHKAVMPEGAVPKVQPSSCEKCHKVFVEGDTLQAFLACPDDPDGSWANPVTVDAGYQQRFMASGNKGIRRRHSRCVSGVGNE